MRQTQILLKSYRLKARMENYRLKKSIFLKLIVELIALTQSRFFRERLMQTFRLIGCPPDSTDQDRQEKHQSPENVTYKYIKIAHRNVTLPLWARVPMTQIMKPAKRRCMSSDDNSSSGLKKSILYQHYIKETGSLTPNKYFI